MKITCTATSSGTELVLDGDLTIYTVAQAKEDIFLEGESLISPIKLDLSHVNELDTAGIQLLLFVQKYLNGENKELQLVKSNDQVDGVMSVLDVANSFSVEN